VRIRNAGRSLARALALPTPFDVNELCRRVGLTRRRPIVLAALPLASAGPCGLWLAADAVDLICYEQQTSYLHQQHIVLHELGHILCGHGEPAAVGELVPQLGANALKIMLARQHASHLTSQERDAELFAYTVMDRAGRVAVPMVDPDRPDGILDRLGRALGE